ncbi:MAG: type IV-A pilus assembly ATPase PilB [Elusimicrobia bacterium]|nr:type IV-A pilus assembly ATPase PilB [Elusimicrobiota bacterium]
MAEATQQHTISLSLSKRLGELMVESGVLTQDQLTKALEIQRRDSSKLGAVLVESKFITEETLLEFLSQQCGISYVSLSKLGPIADDIIKLVPEQIARQHILIPIQKVKNKLTLAVADPLNVLVLDDLKLMTGLDVEIVLASEAEIHTAIEKYYAAMTSQGALEEILKSSNGENGEVENVDLKKEEENAGANIISMKKSGDDAPIIQMVNLILANAVKAKASDIHIEPFPKEMKVRYRIDGVLHEQPAPPKRFQNALASRLKIMANLDIAEHRVPQDGRIKLKIDGKEIDLRVSILPCSPGEKIVMRILDSSGLKVNLTDLGFEPEADKIFQRCMKAPYGINLITGPTGSGKSTTLYSALNSLNDPEINIMTVEDPVEYQLKGINQVQVNADVGLTFAAGLRSFLRQDPDIIMVGEVRDLETITIAINAALTGHLVFSTLHTNDAPGAITRIGMMGVDPFLVGSALLMVVAQRLTRGICKECKEPYEVDVNWLKGLGIPESAMKITKGKVTLYKGKGCDNCAKTGYRGRIGLYEVLDVTDEVRKLILDKSPVTKIKEVARSQGMITLRDCAVRKVLKGVTTVDEMIRLTVVDAA